MTVAPHFHGYFDTEGCTDEHPARSTWRNVVTVNRILAIAALILAILSLFVAGPLLAAAVACLSLAFLL